jgi:radical SAM enzyme (rSAM/lipoprotein system)
MFWECTSRCNIACLHCGSDCKIIEDAPDMPAEDFLGVAKQIAKKFNPSKVMIVISGGEPLVRKDLTQVGQRLKEMGFPWGMVSNGYAMTPQLFSKLRNAGLRSATISLDGLKENHDWLRGRNGSFEKAIDAIKLLAGEKDMVYDVVTCVNQRNISELNDIKKLLLSIGVRRWRLFMIDPIGRAAHNPELLLTNGQFRQMLDFIAANRIEGRIKTSFGCDGYLGDYEANVRDGLFFCRAGIQVGSILANGDIGACPNIHRGFVQGNIYKDNFLDVWENKYHEYRNRKVFKTGQCKDCKQWKYCRGEGMHLREPGNPDPVACHFHKLYEEQK